MQRSHFLIIRTYQISCIVNRNFAHETIEFFFYMEMSLTGVTIHYTRIVYIYTLVERRGAIAVPWRKSSLRHRHFNCHCIVCRFSRHCDNLLSWSQLSRVSRPRRAQTPAHLVPLKDFSHKLCCVCTVLGASFLVLGSWFLILGSWFLVLGAPLYSNLPSRLKRLGTDCYRALSPGSVHCQIATPIKTKRHFNSLTVHWLDSLFLHITMPWNIYTHLLLLSFINSMSTLYSLLLIIIFYFRCFADFWFTSYTTFLCMKIFHHHYTIKLYKILFMRKIRRNVCFV